MSTMMSGQTIAVLPLALRMAERPRSGDWAVLIVPDGRESTVASKLADSVLKVGGDRVTHCSADSAKALILQAQDQAMQVISGLSDLSSDEWARLDRQRSLLLNEGNRVLVLNERGMGKLAACAPNLHSWIGPSMWALDDSSPELSGEAIEHRLDALRAWSGLSDQDVLSKAEAGQLPSDPEYAEWLVLLDRGDLLERGE